MLLHWDHKMILKIFRHKVSKNVHPGFSFDEGWFGT